MQPNSQLLLRSAAAVIVLSCFEFSVRITPRLPWLEFRDPSNLSFPWFPNLRLKAPRFLVTSFRPTSNLVRRTKSSASHLRIASDHCSRLSGKVVKRQTTLAGVLRGNLSPPTDPISGLLCLRLALNTSTRHTDALITLDTDRESRRTRTRLHRPARLTSATLTFPSNELRTSRWSATRLIRSLHPLQSDIALLCMKWEFDQ